MGVLYKWVCKIEKVGFFLGKINKNFALTDAVALTNFLTKVTMFFYFKFIFNCF